MTWLKIDDNFYDHPKIRALELDEFVLHVGALCMSARLLTDGVITDDQLYALARRGLSHVAETAESLSRAGVWSRVDGGYEIRNYLDHNPSKVEVEGKREAERVRKAEWREKKAQKQTKTSTRDAGQTQDTRRGTDTEVPTPRDTTPSHPIPSHIGNKSVVSHTPVLDTPGTNEERQSA